MTTERKFKKGEKIFAEGDTLKSFYMLQSGKVGIFIERGGQKTEVDQPQTGNVFGEQGVFGFPRQAFSAEALSEVKAVEIPLDPIRLVYEKTPPAYKLFVKALGDEVRRLRGVLRSYRMEHESQACPPRFIPRLAAILNLVVKHVGRPPKVDGSIPAYKQEEEKKKNPTFKDTDLLLSFHTLKIYTSRMFLESTQRMQGFCELLCKLGYLHLRFEKNEDTELMELQEVRVHDPLTIEHFGEFYQHNFFKAGKSEVIIVDRLAVQIAGAFATLAKGQEVDRNGAVRLDYKQFLEDMKSKFFIEFKEVHVGLLEKKGLYLKRQTLNEKVYISYDVNEWTTTHKYWQIIQEIDRWNELGFVNMEENLNEYKGQVSAKCTGCGGPLNPAAKFCAECGAKVPNAA